MKILKTFFSIIILIILMIARCAVTGPWMGSVMLGGLLVAWLDIMTMTWDSTRYLAKIRQKTRALFINIGMITVSCVILLFFVLNLIFSYEWLNDPLCLDEITLLTLLLCLIRDFIVNTLIKVIQK